MENENGAFSGIGEFSSVRNTFDPAELVRMTFEEEEKYMKAFFITYRLGMLNREFERDMRVHETFKWFF